MQLIKISKKGNIKSINKDNIDFIKNNKNISKINKWHYNNFTYILYGCINGEAGEENKYDLPPPCDCDLYFNDLYFVKYEYKNIVDLSIEDYNTFYAFCFEGFESIENSDEEEIEEELSEHTSDREFINDEEDLSISSEANQIELSEISDFTSEENKNEISSNNDENDEEENEKTLSDVSSIEITISSCSENDSDSDIESE
tara:strand:+ start:1641 stop:2243 length:603 start_codon:yes stop_codon:yes gene_type:complete